MVKGCMNQEPGKALILRNGALRGVHEHDLSGPAKGSIGVGLEWKRAGGRALGGPGLD